MRKKILLAILIISGIAMLASAGILTYYWFQDRSDERVREAVSALRPDENTEPDAAFADLLAQNPETIGWLQIDGTSVDGVVMYAPNEEDKYLHLDFYGNYSARGTYYLEEQNDVRPAETLII